MDNTTNYEISLQISGVEDLYVLDGGSFFSDSNSSIGGDSLPGQYKLKSLHVQNKGTFELHAYDLSINSQLTLTNLTVRIYQRNGCHVNHL